MSYVKETYVICKRDLCHMEKRPMSYGKETKRPMSYVEETYAIF